MKTTKTNPAATCPTCGMKLTAASAVEGAHAPRPGDPTVCGYCSVALVFTEGLLVRRMTDVDRLALPFETLDEIERARRAVRVLRNRS